MATFKQYKQILSKAVPTCDGNPIMFDFGVECTQVTTEVADTYIVKSDDMCIHPDGVYVAANYRAYPGKQSNGNLVFSSTLTHKPTLHKRGYTGCGGGGENPFCF